MAGEGGEGSSSSVIETIRAGSGVPDLMIDLMVYTAEKKDLTGADFYRELQDFVANTPPDHIVSVFNQIRENVPIRIEVDTRVSDMFWGKTGQSRDQLSPAMRRQHQEWVDSKVAEYCFGAIDENLQPTELGKKMAAFQLKPVLSRILLAGVEFGCGHEVLSIVAMLAVGGSFFSSPEDEARKMQAAQKKEDFFEDDGDLTTLLAIYEAGEEHGHTRKWCYENFISYRRLKSAVEKRNEIAQVMTGMELSIDGGDQKNPMIRKAMATGLFYQAAKWDPQANCYRTLVNNWPVFIRADGALFHKRKPSYVIYYEIVPARNKEYINGVMGIDPKWLLELAPQLYRRASP